MTLDAKISRDLQPTFSQLVLGLSTAALHYLGEKPLDETQPLPVNLSLAKHNIDLIELLSAKTQGNLDEEESRLIREVLTDLRMKYVSRRKLTSNI